MWGESSHGSSCTALTETMFPSSTKEDGLCGDIPEELFQEQPVKGAGAEIVLYGQLMRF